jgi:DNA-binding transcriptional MerR regulator
MKIGELSRRSGVSARMLRYYEREGLLRPSRLASGYRVYGDADLTTVRRIRTLNTAGFRLEVIRRVLPCAREGRIGFAPCVELQNSLRDQIDEIDSSIAALSRSRRTLVGYLVALGGETRRRLSR